MNLINKDLNSDRLDDGIFPLVEQQAPYSIFKSMKLRHVLCILVLVVLSTLLFREVLQEPLMSDDCSYFEYAAGNQPEYVDSNGQRVGFILFIKLFLAIFGYTATAYYATALAAFLTLGLSCYALLSLSNPPVIALVLALITIVEPGLLGISTLVLPEIAAIFWFVFGLFFVVLGLREEVSEKTRLLNVLAAAGCFFCAVWTKETTAFLCVAVPVYLIIHWREKQVRKCLLYLSAFTVGILIIEATAYLIVFGDPFYRINVILGGHVHGARELWIDQGRVPMNYSWSQMLTRFIHLLWKGNFYTSNPVWNVAFYPTYLVLTGLSLVWSIFSKNRVVHLLSLAIVLGFLGMSLAPVKLDPLVPLLRTKHRYITIITLLSSLLVMFGMAAFLRRVSGLFFSGARDFICLLLLAPVVIYSGLSIAQWSNKFTFTMKNGVTAMTDLQRVIKGLKQENSAVGQIVGPWKVLRAGRFFNPSLRPNFIFFDIDFVKFEPGDIYVREGDKMPKDSSIVWRYLGTSRSRRDTVEFFYAVRRTEKSDT